jgi:hypothetical protein
MKRTVLLLLVFSLWQVCDAQTIQPLSQTKPQADRLQGLEYVIPELILGGEWTSVVKLTNRGTRAIPTTNVYFMDNVGNPMSATFQTTSGSVITDVGFSYSLPIGSLLEVTFFGGTSTQFGHAIIGCSSLGCGTPGLYGDVTLRNRNSTRPDFESVFPLEQPAPTQYMLFDGRNGLTTVLYLDNENTTTTFVSIDIIDDANRLIRTISLTMPSLTSQILTLHVLSQETIGIAGTLAIRGQNNNSTALITATALRINPTNSFTPVRAWVASQ